MRGEPHVDPAELRARYGGSPLRARDLPAEPLELFGRWLADAVDAGLPEPNAMVLATASADGAPDARTVLLKGYGADGFVFYTNRRSTKGRELAANPRAALVFPWHAMQRQVRVTGTVGELDAGASAAYFHSRPHGSQLGAWASERQSAVIASRRVLEDAFAALARRWPDGRTVPLPEFWGGYRVRHAAVEFWQGGPDRLHDRLRYRRDTDGWLVERLAP